MRRCLGPEERLEHGLAAGTFRAVNEISNIWTPPSRQGKFTSRLLLPVNRIRKGLRSYMSLIALVAGDGTVFLGEPVVSFAFQQYAIGSMVNHEGETVLANYSGTEIPRRIQRLEAANRTPVRGRIRRWTWSPAPVDPIRSLASGCARPGARLNCSLCRQFQKGVGEDRIHRDHESGQAD